MRNDLGRRFGISPATTSRAVAELIANGLLLETSADVASPGRKPQLLQVNPQMAVLLGLDIQLDGVLAVVTDIAGTLLGRGAVPCHADDGVDVVVRASLTAAERALGDAEIPRAKIHRLGVGHSGDLDIQNGVCVFWANAPNWRSVPIRAKLQEAFGLEVTVDDRSRALALAERHTSPSDWEHPEAAYFHCGPGIGIGFFHEGRLYRGASFGGGEIGHTVIDINGPQCRCGSRGCVESLAGSVTIMQSVREALGAGAASSLQSLSGADLTLRAVVSAARRGDALASAIVDRAANALGTAVANFVQLMNPSLVVLCGQTALIADVELLEAVNRAVRMHCVATSAQRVEIRLTRPKKDISAIGCALLAAEAEAQSALSSFFRDPD